MLIYRLPGFCVTAYKSKGREVKCTLKSKFIYLQQLLMFLFKKKKSLKCSMIVKATMPKSVEVT